MISSPSTAGVGGISACGSEKTELFSCSQRLTDTEKARAIQIVNTFKSTENPVFMVVLQPSSVSNGYQVAIPLDFAREFLTKHKCNLTLCNSAGKTWPVGYYMNAGNRKLRAQLYGGWKAFVQDNHLCVGDICVFEVIKLHEILLRVNIYPVVENASKACRSQAHKSKASPVRTSMVIDTEPDCQQTRCSSISREFKGLNLDEQEKSMDCIYSTKEFGGDVEYSAKHDNGGISSSWGCLKPDLMGKIKMQPSTPTKKQRTAGSRKSKDKSHFPSPRKKMRTNSPSQHGTNSKLVALSSDIDSAFKGSGSGNPVLVMVMQPSYAENIYGGWRAFVKDNHLRVGDIFVFELIKHPGSEILMKVDIYAVVEDTSKDCKPPVELKAGAWSVITNLIVNKVRFEDLTDSDIEILDGFPVNQKTKEKLAPQAEGD
ncbi:hypothetical protein F3Y22_tig00110013pilonHSYRG00383 [Hibiscus syriacus]|uniref:TF-B3 domain-containing protein n=1 Tax=Hibiscus syriacus TaxID=106335 RepID=A0A6A3BNK3_HIBSY|nr:hypothetical protein F3Y22_tig00110013pilonHSYRG00383 [Hibiscus syriacus]